jgi:hypothetical protein
MFKTRILIGLVVLAAAGLAGELKQETVAAWDQHIQSTNADSEERLRTNGQFLWTDQSRDRRQRVLKGEIVVAPAGLHTPIHVPSGLIHHWVGASFIPGVKLNEALAMVRDYGRYRSLYAPSVVQSNLVRRDGMDDEFSVVVVNQALFLKSAIDCDYKVSYHRLDDKRFYSVSDTTRVREIADYGQPGQRRLLPAEGSGYLWRVHSVSRYLERDGGVYVEMETFVLSRDIPISFRWLADPIVRRVSRNSLELTLKQTRDAVSGASSYVSGW